MAVRRRLGPVILGLLAASVCLAYGALSFVVPSKPWLSQKGIGNEREAGEYYEAIGAPPTLSEWKETYGFLPDDEQVRETRGIYYNNVDLGLGRDMHCRRWAGRGDGGAACYVVNHGFGVGAPEESSVEDAITGKRTLATVAMVYTRGRSPADVTFYIYGADESLVKKVALDSEGPKFAPQMCLSCHGGLYKPDSNRVEDASFLPFDLASFRFSDRQRYERLAQEEEFRELNALVRDTSPADEIRKLIDLWYEDTGGVYQPGSVQNNSKVPPEYDDDRGPNERLYENVVAPYCRTCHVAQNFDLAKPEDLSNPKTRVSVFFGFFMPHAERTAHLFWNSHAPAFLANFNPAWTLRVTRTDDPPPDGCDQNGCSLREAILAANSNDPGVKAIIMFAFGGPFVVGQCAGCSGEDEGMTGDLDIKRDVVILGKGLGQTNTSIIGEFHDRIFHIHAGANVVMANVVLERGRVSGLGGGIFVDKGGKLILHSSALRDNGSNGGGAIAAADGSVVRISNSIIGPGNRVGQGSGGGIGNYGGTVNIENTTISGNDADPFVGSGGGISNGASGPSEVTLRHVTISDNGALIGGGVSNALPGAVLTLSNSIVSGNRGVGSFQRNCADDPTGRMISAGYNLFGEDGDAGQCPVGDFDLIVAGGVGMAIEPFDLGFHRLATGSPARDAIPVAGPANCVLPSYDQLNDARPLEGDGDFNGNPRCDIGAVEDVVAPLLNLIRNESFERAHGGLPARWTPSAGFIRSRATPAVTGFHVGEFVAGQAEVNVGQTVRLRIASAKYDVVGWVKIPSTGNDVTFTLGVDWIDDRGEVIGTETIHTFDDDTNGRWTKIATRVRKADGSVRAHVKMTASGLSDPIYVDAFEFRPRR